MGYLDIKQESGTATMPVWQKVLEVVRGGCSLDMDGLTEGGILKAGTPVVYDETTRRVKVAKLTGAVGAKVSDANGMVYDDVKIEDYAPVSVVTRGTCYFNRIQALLGANANEEDAVIDAVGPLIIFSKSF